MNMSEGTNYCDICEWDYEGSVFDCFLCHKNVCMGCLYRIDDQDRSVCNNCIDVFQRARIVSYLIPQCQAISNI